MGYRLTPVPPQLQGASFTASEWNQAVPRGKAHKHRLLQRVHHGVYRHLASEESSWTDLHLPDPAHGYSLSDLRALQKALPPAAYSHLTAAHLYNIPLPHQIQARTEVHISHSPKTSQSERRGFISHRVHLSQDQIVHHRGIAFTNIERTWTDLAALPGLTVTDLVVAGDFVVNGRVVPGRRRDHPVTTINRLSHTLDERGRFHGKVRAREALKLIRVGSDSRPETLLRLALIDAGFPEPELQISVDPHSPRGFTADMAYRELKIALQYDGAHHRTEEQQGRDALRDHWFQAHGWVLLRVTVHDLRTGFARIIDALLPHFH